MAYGALILPSKPKALQRASQQRWNDGRSINTADFFTVGYIAKTPERLLTDLRAAGVSTLIDVRFNPVSQYKPEFSKGNIQRFLDGNGIGYLHRPDWGVPREIREDAALMNNREPIWEWYDKAVADYFFGKNLDAFFNVVYHPVALMCTEVDPLNCHRHRIAAALERVGLKGFDL